LCFLAGRLFTEIRGGYGRIVGGRVTRSAPQIRMFGREGHYTVQARQLALQQTLPGWFRHTLLVCPWDAKKLN